MARWVPDGVDVDRLSTWLDSGVQVLDPTGNCAFIAPKRSREKDCKRHGGEFPALVRAADGQCPVRVEFYTPIDTEAGSTVRAIVVLRGTHSHVFPVCKPSSAVVHDVVETNRPLPIQMLQVHSRGLLGRTVIHHSPSVTQYSHSRSFFRCISYNAEGSEYRGNFLLIYAGPNP